MGSQAHFLFKLLRANRVILQFLMFKRGLESKA